jgi:hypothetical protein
MITDDVSRNLYDLRNYPRYPANNDPINTTVNVDRKDKTLTTYNPTITVSGSGFELSATKDHYTGTPAITTPMSEPDTVTQRVGNAAIKVICPQGQEGHCFTIGNFSTTTSQTGRIGFWLKANPVQDAHVDTVYCGPCTFSFYKDYEGSNVIDCYFSQDMTTYTVSNMEQWNFYEYWWEVSYDVETEEYSYVTDLLINGNSYGGFNGTSWDPISGVSNFILEGWCAAEAESLIFEVDNIMVCIDTATDLYGISEATRWSDILDDRVQFYFRCDVAQQITPLSVSDTDPDNGGTVPIGGYSVFVYFNKALSFYDDSITINNGTPFTPIYDDVLQALVFDVSTEYSQRYDIDVLANQVIDIDDQPLGNTYEFFFLCEEDPTPFSVSYTEPYDGESDVNPAAIVTAYFEGPYPIDPSTINYDTFQLLDSESQLVEGEHSATITAVFTPLSHLTYEETYTVNLTSGVKDSHGRALPPYTSTFTIMSDPYLHLSSHEPPSDTAVPIGITNVSLVFDKPLISYENCVILNDTEYPILTYDDQYTLSFDVDVEYDGTYKVQVVAGVVIADDDSTLSEDAIFTFYGEAPPLEYMHLLETDPTDTAEDVPVDKSCIATFDYEIDSATILDNVMLVDSEYNPIDCNIYSDYNIIHIDPISDLSPGTLYYMGFNTGLLSVEGFSLENIQTPSFTTISDQPVDVNIDVDMKDINIERYYVTIVPERNVVVNTITKNITIEAYDPDINISDKPVITNVVGVFSPGETITIIGNTFGSKIQAAPLKWSNFNDGEDGVQLNTIDPTWVKYNPIGAYYSNVEAHSGDLSVRTNIGTTELFQTNYHQFTPSDEVYLTYWYRTANLPTGTSITSNIKMTRLNSSVASGGGGVYNGIGATTMSNMSASVPEGPYASYSVNGTEENGLEDFRRLDVPFNEWSRIEFYKKLSTPDVANGEVRATCVGRDELVGLNVVNRSSAHVYLNDTVLLGLMEGNDCAGRNYQIYIDDVYIDNTRSRIEIGDSSTWETCTHREILIPTSWSGTSIEGTFNVTQFTFML